ncbi:hypothetical protein HYQ46_002360 [Verticillium longisporum]|nr:hypothetical protein HYQ46_002360 [Verticillium longisporum]
MRSLVGRVKVTVDLVKLLLEASDIHNSLVTQLRTLNVAIVVDLNADPRLHREVVDLYRLRRLFLDDDDLILVGTFPAVSDAVSCLIGVIGVSGSSVLDDLTNLESGLG